ncbi:AEC family transporter [Anoxynatronum buryatiense]|uniref:AEC family transporter n=1 Tax=Anoxynatronum buryatiense TaxID=489973 RepID=A0AA45WXE1_9CLOT|nr:AEC family transporter [Anoxynatronum buryatiense]SMP61957.1 hypothetical protein SAMN06296020_109128 [Anoxynatronum buryatiense]
MLDNLIFSINTALPIFLVMLMGWGLKRKQILNDTFIQTANTLVFYVALPIKLFQDVAGTTFTEAFDTGLVLFLVLATIISIPCIWLIGRFIIREPQKLGAFVHGGFRGNFLYIGFSLLENITGSIGPKAPIAIAFIIPLYNALAVMILALANAGQDKGNRRHQVRHLVAGILRNPLIIAIGAGFVASALSLPLPLVATRTMNYFNALTSPLALIAIGASFQMGAALKNLQPALVASGVKLVLLPLVTVSLAVMLGYTGSDVILVYILFGVPTATTSYIMTAAMGGDKELASSIIMMTTALSVLTMTAFVFAFRSFGII